MGISAGEVLSALLWSAVAGLVTWFALYPVRRRWLTGVFASVVLTGTAASVGALLGGIESMLLPMQEWLPIVIITVGAGAVATVAAGASARRLTADNQALRQAIRELGTGKVPATDGRRLTADLQHVRTELATTAQALAETRDRERSLESARRELVSWVSHDLRTPLAGLRAMAEALEDGMVEDPTRYYKQIGVSVDRLSGMVDDLFDLSRIQAGSLTRTDDEIPLDDLVSDTIAALGPLATAAGVTLVGTAGGATVRGDVTQLDRAVTNLVANAVRHTPESGIVAVTVTRTDEGATVDVTDGCGGISEADMARVFDVGFRGEAARTPGDAGGGLGLAITRGIVEAHEGTVTVENVGAGCRFRIRLPVGPAARPLR